MRIFEARQPTLEHGDHFIPLKLAILFTHHKGHRYFAPARIGSRDYRAFQNALAFVQDSFEFGRIDVLTARNDDVLATVGDEPETFSVTISNVASMKPAAAQRLPRRRLIAPIACQDIGTADENLALRAVGDLDALAIDRLDVAMDSRLAGRADALAISARR